MQALVEGNMDFHVPKADERAEIIRYRMTGTESPARLGTNTWVSISRAFRTDEPASNPTVKTSINGRFCGERYAGTISYRQ